MNSFFALLARTAFALPSELPLSPLLVCNSQQNVTHIGSSPPHSQKLTQPVVNCTEELHASELHLHLLIFPDTLSGRACIPPLQHRRWPRCVITSLNPNSNVPSPKIITVLGQAMGLQLLLAAHIWAAAPQLWHGAEHTPVAGQESPGLWCRAGSLLCPRGCEHGQGGPCDSSRHCSEWSWDIGTPQLWDIQQYLWGVFLSCRLLSSRIHLSRCTSVLSRCLMEKTPQC